ncbi:hypothetical protein AMTRI_Chr10g230480 [Amborella trichopoda]
MIGQRNFLLTIFYMQQDLSFIWFISYRLQPFMHLIQLQVNFLSLRMRSISDNELMYHTTMIDQTTTWVLSHPSPSHGFSHLRHIIPSTSGSIYIREKYIATSCIWI